MATEQQEIMDEHKAKVKAQNESAKERWETVSCRLPKGTKERIAEKGLTVNGLINSLVLEKLAKMEKPFESPHANGGFRFMDWLDYVEERYGYKEVGEVKSPEERAMLEADAEKAGVLEDLRETWEHWEEYDQDEIIHFQLNPDLFPISKIVVDDDTEEE